MHKYRRECKYQAQVSFIILVLRILVSQNFSSVKLDSHFLSNLTFISNSVLIAILYFSHLFFLCREIFSYLDKVDSTCDKALIEIKGNNLVERENVELEFALEPDVIEDVPK